MDRILEILYTAALSFVALFVTAKIMGKKQIAQLEFTDYAIGISIGSIAAQMAIDPDIPYYHFLIAMAVYVVLDLLMTFSARKSFKLKGFLKGKPLILIDDGKLIYDNLKKSKLDINELLALCREKNFFDITEIAYCIFEINGDISILPKGENAPPTCKDLSISADEAQLSVDLIIDGHIIEKALNQIGKTEDWLCHKVGVSDTKALKQVALAIYDDKNEHLVLFYK